MNTESVIALVAVVVALPPTYIVMVKFWYFVRRKYQQPPSDEEIALSPSASLGEQTPYRSHTTDDILLVVTVRRSQTWAP
ncbi:hypothetical protein QBC43DRAFT_305057 [Cladorrhinum sp. PSN259]|nr:hypothetical protein QBC43DRAFT_305057 [Cladorrhinum sp. PSN259]